MFIIFAIVSFFIWCFIGFALHDLNKSGDIKVAPSKMLVFTILTGPIGWIIIGIDNLFTWLENE